MKQKTIYLRAAVKPYLPAVAALALLFAWSEGVLWGLPLPQGQGELAVRAFFKWHLLTIPPLLFASEYLSAMDAMEVFIRVRVRSDKRLHRRQVRTCLGAGALWGALAAAVAFAREPAALWCVPVTVAGHLMWMSLYLLVYYAFRSVSGALIGTVLGIGMGFYVGELALPGCAFLPFSWAMPARTAVFHEQGAPLPLALGGCLGAMGLCLAAIHFINRKRRLWL